MSEMTKGEVLQSVGELEALLEKAQIVRGGNSERKNWAGSTWTDEDIPTSTPNGTDWVPPKRMARKALDSMTQSEIENYLEMRKSGTPNPIAAEREILTTVPGVEKAMCPQCEGTQRDQLNKGSCGRCNGFGFVWMVPTQEAGQMLKSIEQKWNLHKAVQHDHGVAEEGGEEGADTTPKDGDTGGKEEKPETVMSSPNPSAPRKAIKKAKKAMDKMVEEEEMGDDEEGAKEEIAELLEGEDGEKCSKTKKSVETAALHAILKSMGPLLDKVEVIGEAIQDLYGTQAEQSDLLNSMGKSFVGLSKSLEIPAPAEPTTPQPARGAKAVQSLQVLQKGFVDQAPEGSPEGAPRYDLGMLKKAATNMVIKGKLDKRVGLRLDANDIPEEKVLKSIEAWIDEHGVD